MGVEERLKPETEMNMTNKNIMPKNHLATHQNSLIYYTPNKIQDRYLDVPGS